MMGGHSRCPNVRQFWSANIDRQSVNPLQKIIYRRSGHGVDEDLPAAAIPSRAPEVGGLIDQG